MGYAPLGKIFSSADLLLCTSAYEGFPYIFLDSIFRGVPVISTRVGGADEVITDDCGLFLDEGVDALCRYLTQFQLDEEFRNQQRIKARLISNRYSLQIMSQSTINLLRNPTRGTS